MESTKGLHRYLGCIEKMVVSVENYNGGLGEIRAQVESGNVTWDVVDVLPDHQMQ